MSRLRESFVYYLPAAVCGEAIAALKACWPTADPYGLGLVQSQPPARINRPQIESTANKTEDRCHSLRLNCDTRRLPDLGGSLGSDAVP